MKICNKCREEKELSEFRKDSSRKDGYEYVCKTCIRKKDENRYWSNPDKERDRGIKYYWDNLERQRNNSKAYKKANPEKTALNHSEKLRIKKMGQPKWLSAIELAQIQEFYDIADMKTMQTGISHHVDHIHALRGNGFNGLHVPWNLQVITAEENMRKRNKLPVSDKNLAWGV